MSYSVVLFGASWCQPCKAVKPLIIGACAAAGIEYEHVDVESYDPRANDITAVPTVRAYDEYGDVIAEHRGGMTAAQVDDFIRGLAE